MDNLGNQGRLGATEVRKAVLTTRRGGYDQAAVDTFLDEVADQLDLPVEQRTLTAAQVTEQAFTASPLRQGYTEKEVDDLLDAVADRLRADEVAATAHEVTRDGPARGEPASSAPAEPATGPAALPPLREPTSAEDAGGHGPDQGEAAEPETPFEQDRRAASTPVASPISTPPESFAWLRRLTRRRRRGDG